MRKIITQIYEIQTPEEAARAIAAGVDHIGSVVLSPENWKVPSIRETIRQVSHTAATSSLILLYHQPDLVFDSIAYYQPNVVHFCENLVDGNFADDLEDQCRLLVRLQESVRKEFPEIRIMRTIPIPVHPAGREFPFLELARIFEQVSDYFLTDTLIMGKAGMAEQPVDGFVGITGFACDWEAARLLVESTRIPVILAGGLSPENVYEGIARVRPFGVDSCTQTNAIGSDGDPVRFQKDFDRVAKFVSEARRAEADFLL